MTQRVLIVDDNRELAENIAEILEAEGYDARVAFHPEAAIAIARETPYDVAILDVRLPGMDGVSLFEELSRLHPKATYLLMTAFTTDDRITHALAHGVSAVLPKPIPFDKLMRFLPTPRAGQVSDLLLVEDDEGLREALAEALAGVGYRIRHVSTVASASAELAAATPAAMIVDLRLPDGDGAELARDACARVPGLPVVLTTAYDAEDALAALKRTCAGHVAMLQKPFPTEALLETLRQLGRPPTTPPPPSR